VFILDGMIKPDPSKDGIWADTLYYFDPDKFVYPKGGNKYSEENADWQYENETENIPFNHVSVALPIGSRLVLAASYNNLFSVFDYDRNDTFLDPHFGRRADPRVQAAYDDTLHMDWFKYIRERTGDIHNITGAVSFKLSKNISLGVGINSFSGKTNDILTLNQKGSFDIVYGKTDKYRFFHKDSIKNIAGTSEFSGTSFNAGAILSFDHFSLGFDLKLPYKLKREWDYTIKLINPDVAATKLSGTEEVELPLCYTFGISIKPIKNVLLAFDFERNLYHDAEFKFSDENLPYFTKDELPNYTWSDQTIYKVGAEYNIFKGLSLLFGYKNVPQAFIPQGAPYREQGPSAKSISTGVSLKTELGRLDIAYKRQILKYYDIYENNVNYAYERHNQLLFGYTFVF